MYISLVVIFGILGVCLASKVPQLFHAEVDNESKEITITKSSETDSDFDDSFEHVTVNNYLYGEETDKNSSYVGNTATPISTFNTGYYSSSYQNQTSTSSYANQHLSTTTEEELLYLVYDYDYMDREVNFFKYNTLLHISCIQNCHIRCIKIKSLFIRLSGKTTRMNVSTERGSQVHI